MSYDGAYLRFVDNGNCILTYVEGGDFDTIVDWAELCKIGLGRQFRLMVLDLSFLNIGKLSVYYKPECMHCFTRSFNSRTQNHEAFLFLQLYKQGFFADLGVIDVYTHRGHFDSHHYKYHYENNLTVTMPLCCYANDCYVYADIKLEMFMCLDISKIKREFKDHYRFIYFITNTIGWHKEPMSEKRINDFLLTSIHKHAYQVGRCYEHIKKPKTKVVKGKLV